MAKDGHWTSGSMGYCMKVDCRHHKGVKDCGVFCPQYRSYDPIVDTQLDLPFKGETK